MTPSERIVIALLTGLANYIEDEPRTDDPATDIAWAIRRYQANFEAVLREGGDS